MCVGVHDLAQTVMHVPDATGGSRVPTGSHPGWIRSESCLPIILVCVCHPASAWYLDLAVGPSHLAPCSRPQGAKIESSLRRAAGGPPATLIPPEGTARAQNPSLFSPIGSRICEFLYFSLLVSCLGTISAALSGIGVFVLRETLVNRTLHTKNYMFPFFY